MKIDVSNLFNGDSKPIKIDYTLDLEDLVYSTYNPIKDGAKVRGSVYEKANVVFLDTEVSFKFYGFCDRCAEKVIKDMSFPVKRSLFLNSPTTLMLILMNTLLCQTEYLI